MQTPCIDVCSIDPKTGLCTGCGRTLLEIGGWMSFSDEEREQLMAILPARLVAKGQGISQATAERRA